MFSWSVVLKTNCLFDVHAYEIDAWFLSLLYIFFYLFLYAWWIILTKKNFFFCSRYVSVLPFFKNYSYRTLHRKKCTQIFLICIWKARYCFVQWSVLCVCGSGDHVAFDASPFLFIIIYFYIFIYEAWFAEFDLNFQKYHFF